MGKFKTLIFVPNEEQKLKAMDYAGRIIHLLSDEPVEMKAFVLQHLISSFEETAQIDLRHGISIKKKEV